MKFLFHFERKENVVLRMIRVCEIGWYWVPFVWAGNP